MCGSRLTLVLPVGHYFQDGVLRFSGRRYTKTSAYALLCLEHLFVLHNLFEIWLKFNL